MKKRFLYIAVIAIFLSLITGGTYAYFTAADTVRNVITSGGIGVEVVQQQWSDGVLKPDMSQTIPVMPGAVVSKVISVRSEEQPAWIRMNYQVVVRDGNGEQMEISPEELEKVIVITPDSENWTLKDGWWYYHTAVNTGEMTKPLFETVSFSAEDMDNKYQLCTVTLVLKAQAVQKSNNGDSVFDAMGWPAN